MGYDRFSLPEEKPSSESGNSRFSWTWLSLAVLLLVSTSAFHWRWERPISSSPVTLPEISHAFTTHDQLLPFDEATQAAWASIINPRWWDMTWVDGSGQAVVRGLDMFHKLHCLIAVREEFTALALDPDRRRAFQAKGAEAEATRLHLGHCFDFLRQGITCAADATLEPLGPGYIEESGEGVVHQCRDWSVLMSHAGLTNDFRS